jgi:UDP-N-acetylglucosamine acyltransferase
MIHPTAIVHPDAQLDAAVRIGPHCVIGPHVVILGQSVIGARNRFHAGCVIGDAPQDLKYRGEPTRLRIGDDNIFREHVTVHRSNQPGEETVIGSNNYFMQHAHVAHNCRIANHTIIAGGALLAGHVEVQERAFISGNCLVHQFCRVGALALMQGGSAISKDLPPFTIALRENEICGLNLVGLRRAGFTPEQRLELKRLYHALFRSGQNLRAAVAAARQTFTSPAARQMLDFIAESRRGVCADVSAGKRQPDPTEPAGLAETA